MKNLVLIGFIIALPALAAIGHDIYLAYINASTLGPESFEPSDLGWLWVEYSPDTYDYVRDSTDASVWNNFLDPLLRQRAMLVGMIPLGIYVCLLVIMKIFGFGAFKGHGVFSPSWSKGKQEYSFRADMDAKRTKYKRK